MLILIVSSSSSRTVGGQRSKTGLSECNTLSAGGSWDPQILKLWDPEEPAESHGAQRLHGPQTGGTWRFPDADNPVAGEVTQESMWSFSSHKAWVQTFIVIYTVYREEWQLRLCGVWVRRNIRDPQGAKKQGICWANDQVQELWLNNNCTVTTTWNGGPFPKTKSKSPYYTKTKSL